MFRTKSSQNDILRAIAIETQVHNSSAVEQMTIKVPIVWSIPLVLAK